MIFSHAASMSPLSNKSTISRPSSEYSEFTSPAAISLSSSPPLPSAFFVLSALSDLSALSVLSVLSDLSALSLPSTLSLSSVEVVDAGETSLIVGEHLDKDDIEEINRKAELEGLTPAKVEAILLGLTRASLQTKSFISAASFQETTRVLTDSAVQGRVDRLRGLKENVILGRLIPAGTGLLMEKLKKQGNDEIKNEEQEEGEE